VFHLTVLGSGSSGNCAVVETDQCRLLIDGGLSARQITRRLETVGLKPIEIDGILLTHEHCDHVQGLNVFCKQNAIPVYCNRETAEAIRHCPGAGDVPREWRFFQTGSEFAIKDIVVQTFPIPHDAVDPVGFVLHHDDRALGFLTDLGYPTKLVLERVREVDALVLETNHDEKLLQEDSRRPWPVKQRIMSRHGHLSNTAAAQVASILAAHDRLRRVVLGHLSKDCNRPELALAAVRQRLSEIGSDGIEVFCASPSEPGPRFQVGPDSLVA
jgi:phosphoribosyl 1,2-cyclic phosphodiesterase